MPNFEFDLVKVKEFTFGRFKVTEISDRTAKQLAIIGIGGALLVGLILGLAFIFWVA